jgi:tetratricopeptide (TPR) repeat protein
LYQKGKHLLGLTLIEESRQLAVKHGRLPLVAEIENNYGWIALYTNNFEAAWSHFEKYLHLSQKVGRKINIPEIHNAFGDTLFYQKKYDKAIIYYQNSLDMFMEWGNTAMAAELIEKQGKVALRKGQLDKSKALYFESLALLRDIERRAFKVARCLFGLAQIADIEERLERFVTLLSASEAHRNVDRLSYDVDQSERDRVISKLPKYLEKPSLKNAYTRGLAMTKEQAIDYALSDEDTSKETSI